jgi:hypothetical protein
METNDFNLSDWLDNYTLDEAIKDIEEYQEDRDVKIQEKATKFYIKKVDLPLWQELISLLDTKEKAAT